MVTTSATNGATMTMGFPEYRIPEPLRRPELDPPLALLAVAAAAMAVTSAAVEECLWSAAPSLGYLTPGGTWPLPPAAAVVL